MSIYYKVYQERPEITAKARAGDRDRERDEFSLPLNVHLPSTRGQNVLADFVTYE